MINHVSRGGIYWTIQTCLTNLKFSEHLLFANLNDFSLKSTDFIKDSQMQVVYFCKFFFYKNQFSQKNVLCLMFSDNIRKGVITKSLFLESCDFEKSR